MQKRVIGDLLVSPISLGTVKFGRNQGLKYPHTFTLPSDQSLANLLAMAHDLGINLLDTAPAYGTSEERLGKLLEGQRKNWVISTKVGEEFNGHQSHFDFSPQAIQKSLIRSLKRLHTDYLDIVLIHSNGDDEAIIEKDQVFTTLAHYKKIGMIRAFGMSCKTREGGLLTITHSDVAMVTYNPLYTKEKEVIDKAYCERKGILIKKALVSGHLDQIKQKDPVQYTLEFIFKVKGISSVVIGTINPLHLKKNVALFLTMANTS